MAIILGVPYAGKSLPLSYIWPKFMVNVGKYTIHGLFGVWYIYQHSGSLRGQHGSTKANTPYNECLRM